MCRSFDCLWTALSTFRWETSALSRSGFVRDAHCELLLLAFAVAKEVMFSLSEASYHRRTH